MTQGTCDIDDDADQSCRAYIRSTARPSTQPAMNWLQALDTTNPGYRMRKKHR